MIQVLRSASGTQRAFLVSAAAFLLVASFPSSAGWRVFFLFVAFGALALQAWRGAQPLELRKVPRPLALAALAWVLLCLASLAWSVDPGFTLQEARRELLYGAMAFLVFFVGTRQPAHLHLWIATLLFGAIILGIGEWLRLLFPGAALLRKASMEPGPFSTHILLLAPLLVLVAWRPPIGMGRSVALAIALGVALIVAGMACESRILWLALFIAATVAYLTFRVETEPHDPSRKAAKRVLLVTLALLPALMLMSAEYKLRYYPRAASTAESLAFDERPVIWEVASRKVAERPWIGHGYGREIVGADIRQGLLRAGVPRNFMHGHNVLLDAALQLGALGVAAFVALLAAIAWAYVQARGRENAAPLAIAGLAGLAGYLVKNMTDDFFFRPNSLVFWAITGMLLGLAARSAAKG